MPGLDVANNILATFGRVLQTLDYDDPEYQRMLLRPAVISEDMRTMAQRKRVKKMLHSDAFRQELDAIIASQMGAIEKPSSCHPGLKLSLTGGSIFEGTANVGASMSTINGGQTFTRPMTLGQLAINDLKVHMSYSERESHQRCKLGALYRLIDLFDWTSSIYNHISLRIDKTSDAFLVNPFGLLYNEVTAASLLTVDLAGNVLDQGCTNMSFDEMGWKLHGLFHGLGVERIRCIIHLTLPSVVAVSSMGDEGLLPLSRESVIMGPVHCLELPRIMERDFKEEEILHEAELMEQIKGYFKARDGADIHAFFVRGQGLVVFGLTVEETWFYASNAIYACESQLSLSSVSREDLWLVSEDEQKSIKKSFIGEVTTGSRPTSPLAPQYREKDDWRVGEMEFEALMRHLDNAGYRTGHFYRSGVEQGLRPMSPSPYAVTPDQGLSNDAIQVPPSVVSMGATHLDVAINDALKIRSETPYWQSSHQGYHRCTDVSGSQSRWVPESEVAAATIRVASSPILTPRQNVEPQPNKFAPQGENPREFVEKQNQLKDMYYNDESSTGPQSKLVEGLTYEELMRLKDKGLAKLNEDGNRLILLAASSKAIIDKDYQRSHPWLGSVNGGVGADGDTIGNITGNPFEKVSDVDLECYRRDVELKNNPEYQKLLMAQQEKEAALLNESSGVVGGVFEIKKETRLQPDISVSCEVEQEQQSPPSPSSGPKMGETTTSGVDDTEEGTATDGAGTLGHSEGKEKKKKKRFGLNPFSKKKK